MSGKSKGKGKKADHEVRIENRRARHDYAIIDTLECGIRLLGTEVKSARDGKVSLAEGYVRAVGHPVSLTLHSAHIAEYPPAGTDSKQHDPIRTRQLLAHKREIRKLADKTREKGVTLVPLKMYTSNGRFKLLIGLAKGKSKTDKRQDIAKREAKRDIDRALAGRG